MRTWGKQIKWETKKDTPTKRSNNKHSLVTALLCFFVTRSFAPFHILLTWLDVTRQDVKRRDALFFPVNTGSGTGSGRRRRQVSCDGDLMSFLPRLHPSVRSVCFFAFNFFFFTKCKDGVFISSCFSFSSPRKYVRASMRVCVFTPSVV